jgi:DNA-binding SARP family transcriptional activator
MKSPDVHEGENGRANVTIDARVFGRFSVVINGRLLDDADWGRVSAERLFKLILISPGHHVRRDITAEALWPETDPSHQSANLRKALHFARRALERDGRVLGNRRDEISLETTVQLSLDLDQFLAASRRIARAGGALSGSAVSEADVGLVLRLGALELLPDERYQEWPASLREMTALRWQTLAVETARARVCDGRIAEAWELVNSVLSRDSADEDAHLLLSELLTKQGHAYAARRQLHFARRRLAEVFSDDASPAMNGLLIAH